MSYEGSEQHICAKGHLWECPAPYMMNEGPTLCPECQAPSVWRNSVDDTNCNDVGRILDFEPFKLTDDVAEYCNLGHRHVTAEATYRVPTEDEAEQARSYYDPLTGERKFFVPR